MNLDINFTVGRLAIMVVMFLSGAAGLTLKHWTSGFGLRGGMRTTFYLTRYDAALEFYGIASRERRERVSELRANLADSAREVGLARALAGLGPPQALAAETSAGRYAPSWLRGVVWTAAAGLIWGCAAVLSAVAFLDGFGSVASPGAFASWTAWGWTLTATAHETARHVSSELVLSLLWLPVLLIPFLVGARVWRVWTGQRHPAGFSV
ncbi:MAG: hypothetical protein ABIS84_05835 [Arachnia sp.]